MGAAPLAEHYGPMGRRTLDQLLPSVGGAMGVPGFTDVLGLPEAPRYVVMVVDGLGSSLLAEHQGNISAVARAMGKARMQIQRWIKRYNLKP